MVVLMFDVATVIILSLGLEKRQSKEKQAREKEGKQDASKGTS